MHKQREVVRQLGIAGNPLIRNQYTPLNRGERSDS